MNLSIEIEILMVGMVVEFRFTLPIFLFSSKNPIFSPPYMNIFGYICINALYQQPLETVNSHTQFIDTCDDILLNIYNHTAKYKIMTSDLNFGNCYS